MKEDVTPVCSCNVDGYSFTNLTIPRYCQALDTVDNKVREIIVVALV